MGFFDDFFGGSGSAGGLNPGGQYINGPTNAANISAQASAEAARNAELLNRERYGESQRMLSPYLQSELNANQQLNYEMGLPQAEGVNYMPQSAPAYRNTPGYQGAIQSGIDTVNAGAAGAGSLYSGARGDALRTAGQNVEQSYYSNYMNMLQGMANPSATTNLSSLGMGQAATIGGQNIGAAAQQGQFRQQGAQATQQAQGDAIGAIISMFL